MRFLRTYATTLSFRSPRPLLPRSLLPGQVVRFLDTKHPSSYLVFNLCAERAYDPARFAGRVTRLPVPDHQPPRLPQLAALLRAGCSFIGGGEGRCLAVHCKGGKGRTGVAVAAWLLFTGFARDPEDALSWFAAARTGRRARAAQGVSQPSQRR